MPGVCGDRYDAADILTRTPRHILGLTVSRVIVEEHVLRIACYMVFVLMKAFLVCCILSAQFHKTLDLRCKMCHNYIVEVSTLSLR